MHSRMCNGDGGGRVIRQMASMAILLCGLATATPTITFPLNSQVPPVARVSQPFSFTFSESTFSSDGAITYTLSDAPSWLSLDGATRTLSGMPPQADADTAPVIDIVAADDTGSVIMSSVFVISSNTAPQVAIPLKQQLEAFGDSSEPNSLIFSRSTSFSFSFNKDTFKYKSSTANLNKYAITLDNTPLPSWLTFDGSTMTFSGKTPDPDPGSLIQQPELFGIQLIASEILGFAGVSIPFHIVVGNQKLVWDDTFLEINASVEAPIEFKALSGSLKMDGAIVNPDMVTVTTDAPNWLEFNSATFILSGTPPEGSSSFNITVTARDKYDDVATATIHVAVSNSLFVAEDIAPINATMGAPFSYNISSAVVDSSAVNVAVSISPETSWLSFDSKTLMLSGQIPQTTETSSISVTLTATLKSILSKRDTNSKTFDINVVSASPTSNPKTAGVATVGAANKGLRPGEIAAAVVVPIVVLALAALILFCCWRRRKNYLLPNRADSPTKRDISNPVMQEPSPIMTQNASPKNIHPGLRPQTAESTEDMYGSEDSFNTRAYDATARRSITLPKTYAYLPSDAGSNDYARNLRRSCSETNISSLGSSYLSTQGGSDPQYTTNINHKRQVKRNFSHKINATHMTPDPAASFSQISMKDSTNTYNPYYPRSEKVSIQETAEAGYTATQRPYRVHKRHRTPNHLGSICNIPSRGIGHGRSGSVLSERSTNSVLRPRTAASRGYGHGHSHNASIGFPSNGSWLTVPDSPKKRPSTSMTALTESTDILYPENPLRESAGASHSPERKTIRLVSQSSDMGPSFLSPTEPQNRNQYGSLSADPGSAAFARYPSRRAPGTSPFFSGSSLTNSRATSRRSAKLLENYMFSDAESPALQENDETNASLERSILQELRRSVSVAVRKPLDAARGIQRDILGISYGNSGPVIGDPRKSWVYVDGGCHSPEKASTRQMSTKRSSWATQSNSHAISDASSRFRPASTSPATYGRENEENKENEDIDNDDDDWTSHYDSEAEAEERGMNKHHSYMSNFSTRSPPAFRDSMGNSILYGEDESPKLEAAGFVERPSMMGGVGSLLFPDARLLGEGSGGGRMYSPSRRLTPVSPIRVEFRTGSGTGRVKSSVNGSPRGTGWNLRLKTGENFEMVTPKLEGKENELEGKENERRLTPGSSSGFAFL